MFILLPVFAWLQQISYVGRLRPYPGRPEALHRAPGLRDAPAQRHVPGRDRRAVDTLVACLRWLILAWLVVYVLRSKHAIYGGSRWGGIVRTLFVVVAYTFFMASRCCC